MSRHEPLPASALRRTCDPATLPEDGAAPPAAAQPFGQDRAARAARFAVAMTGGGYNVYVMGPADAGKSTAIRALLEDVAATAAVPRDVCYVFDFEQPQRPRALLLPAGRGRALRDDLQRFAEEVRVALAAAFEGEDLDARKRVIENETKELHDEAFEELRVEAARRGIAFLRTPLGFGFAAMRDGSVLSPEEFARLPEGERERIGADIGELQERLRDVIRRMQGLAREERQRLRDLLREVAAATVGHLIEELKARWGDEPAVLAHIEAIRADVVENVEAFAAEEQGGVVPPPALGARGGEPASARRHLANLLVDRADARGAPVVFEDHPTLANLVGRVEHVAVMGALLSDFHLIRAGALHRANGGYLVLDARAVLSQPYAWEALKRTLAAREVRIESLAESMGFGATLSLEPAPVALDVKVVLVGERRLYYLLDALDPDFRTLFQVVADFEDDVARDVQAEGQLARIVTATATRHGLLPFARPAVARVVERSARVAGDAQRLSTHMGALAELLRESDRAARDAGHAAVAADDVDRAVAAAEARVSRARDLLLEHVRRGLLHVETRGSRVGQVNGLSVLQLGGFAFGQPMRITAKVRLGKGEVVDVQREVALSGPIHSKGVLILGGFLAGRYAPEHPLSLSATLAFEQSYGLVDGDSASCAELCALLSALSGVPLSQSLAVTGAVDQHGVVQPVGGVDEKIEGFFDACRVRGASGEEGVIVPATNAASLMLRPDVVRAVEQGRFRVYAAHTVDDVLELLTGALAGERDAAGLYPAESVNGRVEARLVALAERRLALGAAQRSAEPAS